jgi:hypothetical protein
MFGSFFGLRIEGDRKRMIIKITAAITLEKHELDDLQETIRTFVEGNRHVTKIELQTLTEEQRDRFGGYVIGHECIGMVVRAEGHMGPGVKAIAELIAKMDACAAKESDGR